MTTHIRSLPSELIHEILQNLLSALPIDDLPLHEYHHWRFHVLAASQVCEDWRRLVLSSPLLWNFVRLGSGPHPEWTTHCLDHSSSAPITLVFRGAFPLDMPKKHQDEINAIRQVLASVKRVEAIHWHVTSMEIDFMTEEVVAAVRKHRPQARELKVFSNLAGFTHAPDALFQDALPGLQTIRFINISPRGESNSYQNLTTFAFTSNASTPSSFVTLFRLLSQMPKLVNLKIRCFERLDIDLWRQYKGRRVSLASLTAVDVQLNAQDVIFLFSFIAAPKLRLIDVRNSAPDSHGDPVGWLMNMNIWAFPRSTYFALLDDRVTARWRTSGEDHEVKDRVTVVVHVNTFPNFDDLKFLRHLDRARLDFRDHRARMMETVP